MLVDKLRMNPFIKPSNLVLHHDYLSGTALDSSGFGNNGTVNGVTFGPSGLIFDGIAGKNVTVVPALSIQFGVSDFAYFFWANLTNNGAIQTFFYTGALTWLRFVANFSTGTLSAFLYGAGIPTNRYAVTVTPVSMTGWRLFGYEIDRDVGAIISVDGVSLNSPTGDLWTISPSFSMSAFFIGSEYAPQAHPEGQIHVLDGTLGETLWYNAFGAYSGLSRLDLYNSTKGRYI